MQVLTGLAAEQAMHLYRGAHFLGEVFQVEGWFSEAAEWRPMFNMAFRDRDVAVNRARELVRNGEGRYRVVRVSYEVVQVGPAEIPHG